MKIKILFVMKLFDVNQTHKTKGIKFGNYDKINEQGFIPENTLVENRDVIIAKTVPIKENRNDPPKPSNMKTKVKHSELQKKPILIKIILVETVTVIILQK